jgi:mono/diheme cytochrome c family protein
MAKRACFVILAAWLVAMVVSACDSPNPQPPGLTPIPVLPPGATPTLIPSIGVTPVAPTSAPAATVVPGATPAPAAPTSAPAAPDAALGAAVFLLHCTTCHGPNGEGGTNFDENDVPALRNDAFVQNSSPRALELIATGRTGTGMPAWALANGGPLTDQDIANVLAYLQTLQGAPALPTLPPAPKPTPASASPAVKPSGGGNPSPAASLTGDLNSGRGLFGKYCAECHGPQGWLGKPNPGSTAGFVPALKPIHPSIANADAKVFANNVDLFIEHGSLPAGNRPLVRMPSFGDSKLLTAQQIADIIAYVISLNK